MADVTWKIHGILDIKEYYKEKDGKDYPYIGNFHTHGLKEYNNQRELCIVMALPEEQAAGLLNHMGLKVANNETVFTEGIRTDILSNNMDVQLLSFDNDPVLYVILPDANGKLPMDDDCEEPFKYQYEYAKLISDDDKSRR
jgi:hypothetical protein